MAYFYKIKIYSYHSSCSIHQVPTAQASMNICTCCWSAFLCLLNSSLTYVSPIAFRWSGRPLWSFKHDLYRSLTFCGWLKFPTDMFLQIYKYTNLQSMLVNEIISKSISEAKHNISYYSISWIPCPCLFNTLFLGFLCFLIGLFLFFYNIKSWMFDWTLYNSISAHQLKWRPFLAIIIPSMVSCPV